MPDRPRKVACLRCSRAIVRSEEQVCADGQGSSAKCTYCKGLNKPCIVATSTLRAKIGTMTQEAARNPVREKQFENAKVAVRKALHKETDKKSMSAEKRAEMDAKTKEDREGKKLELSRRQTAAQEGIHDFLESISNGLAALRQGLVPAVDEDGDGAATDLLSEVTKATTLFAQMAYKSAETRTASLVRTLSSDHKDEDESDDNDFAED